MTTYGVTEIQSKPSLFKEMDLAEIVDKRVGKTLGYFISDKYEKYIKATIDKIEREERRKKLRKLKSHQDIAFLENGIEDGL